ncbi:MAG: response regulator [Thermodesulfobacteriota bacterium]|nr:response regulator [Thermodesulfobacteriota bacterium]
MKILIVDDEITSRVKAETILSQYGECDMAASGAEAVERFIQTHENERPYDVIIMDIHMPELNGIQTLKQMRDWETTHNIQVGYGVKVVMLTADDDPGIVRSSFRELCDAYVIKPFNSKKIIEGLVLAGIKISETAAELSREAGGLEGEIRKVTTELIRSSIRRALGSSSPAWWKSVQNVDYPANDVITMSLKNGQEIRITVQVTEQ